MGKQVFGKVADDGLGVAACLQSLKCFGAALLPVGIQGVHAVDKADKLGVFVDGRLDGKLCNSQIKVAGTVGLEQGRPKLRADFPVRL